jgi:hypothetical protein
VEKAPSRRIEPRDGQERPDKPSFRRRGSFVTGKRFAEARDWRTEMALEPSRTPTDQIPSTPNAQK